MPKSTAPLIALLCVFVYYLCLFTLLNFCLLFISVGKRANERREEISKETGQGQESGSYRPLNY